MLSSGIVPLSLVVVSWSLLLETVTAAMPLLKEVKLLLLFVMVVDIELFCTLLKTAPSKLGSLIVRVKSKLKKKTTRNFRLSNLSLSRNGTI